LKPRFHASRLHGSETGEDDVSLEFSLFHLILTVIAILEHLINLNFENITGDLNKMMMML
jgi:uncharacterized protein (UPF0333 family)